MSGNTVRLLNLGEVPYLRSQTIYHAVAEAMDDDSPNTVVLASPREPYVCIGFHQDMEREIDLDYCGARRLPVLRREVGGGTVYLDRQQLFYHCVFHRRRAPRRVDDIYRLFLQGPIETYRRLGVEARLGAANDILVGDRKIGGTGAGGIGEAVVVCGSIIFDFDHETTARLLRAPGEAFREQVQRKMWRYITSLKRELGREVDRGETADLLAGQFGETLGMEVVPGEFTAEEWAHVERLDALFETREWLHAIRRPGMAVRQVKIRAGVLVCEASHERDGLRARVTLSLVDGRVDDVRLAGDVGLGDEERERLEGALRGLRLVGEDVGEARSLLGGREGVRYVGMVEACLRSIAQSVC